MAHEEWLARWREGRIGFHRAWPHEALVAHWAALGLPDDARVLVPLCGKSVDMRWLARRGHTVLGIELAPEAIEQFVSASAIPVARYSRDGFECYRQDGIELRCGNFFHVQADESAALAAFYDRAALIALPEATRQRYAFHLAQLLPPGSAGLLISLTHARGTNVGPPYCVTDEEIAWLFGPNFMLECLDRLDVEEDMHETVWKMVRKGPQDDEALAVR